MSREQAAPYLAEFLGTFALVFAGPGSMAVDAASGGAVGGVGIGLSFGFIVMAMIFALGHVSGCHINPAITAAFAATRRIRPARAAGYIAAQLAGAALAGLAVVAIVGDYADAGASLPRLGGADAALASEIVLTFFLALIVFSVATDARAQGAFAAIAIGGYVAMAATGWGPVANASMNPARSFGPAVASGAWDAHWVYWLGPGLGAVLAAFAYELLRPGAPPPPPERS
ncbi:aquaporin [Tepidiforma flava]|uniref:Aquaporin n=1 Tax=Tepidiforma flava TaxID=3004094 RepID=A0ABY7MA51_9CHLR|nr:aquaporin [Tepidiforma flava]WBL37417.1 aquaporin [Tepidiforma flava]